MEKNNLDIDFLYLENTGKKINITPGDNSEGIMIDPSGEIQLFTPSQENLPKNRETIFSIIGLIELFSSNKETFFSFFSFFSFFFIKLFFIY